MINKEANKIEANLKNDIRNLKIYKKNLYQFIDKIGTAKKINYIETNIEKKKNTIIQMRALEEREMIYQLPSLSNKILNILKKNNSNYKNITKLDVERSFKKYYKLDTNIDYYTKILEDLNIDEDNIEIFFNKISLYIDTRKKIENLSNKVDFEKYCLIKELIELNKKYNNLKKEYDSINDFKENMISLLDITDDKIAFLLKKVYTEKEIRKYKIDNIKIQVENLKDIIKEKIKYQTNLDINTIEINQNKITAYNYFSNNFPNINKIRTEEIEEIRKMEYMEDIYKVYSIVNKTNYKPEDYVNKIYIKKPLIEVNPK